MTMKRYRTGYTQGVYDMFHIGHLNFLNNVKKQCEYLIVGVNSDKLVHEYKNKTPVIGETERSTIVANIKAVDECFVVDTLDKVQLMKQIGFDAIFIGEDWKGNPRWEQTRKDLAVYGVDVIFLPRTKGISSTMERGKYDLKVSETEEK